MLLATKDPEYLAYEKTFKDFSKQTEVLARDARIFRDGIAGRRNRIETK